MPKLPFETKKAPTGYDSTNDVTLLAPNRARLLRNFIADRAGNIRASLQKTTIQTFGAPIDGVFWYSGETAEDDQLLVVSGGSLWKGVPSLPLTSPPQWAFVGIGGGFLTGAQVRAQMFGTELIFVQEGGITPLRYNGTDLFQCGISAPTAAPMASLGTPSNGASTNKSGTVSYRYRFYDEFSRESEPSDSVSLTFSGSYDAYITIFNSWLAVDPQVYGAYLEATTPGGSVYYRISTLTRAENEVTYEDNLTSALTSAGTVSAGLGRYSVPNTASCIAAHKNYLLMNDTTNGYNLQISRLNVPTQWSTVTEVTASDGARLRVPGAREGNPVRQIVQFGSLLVIWLKQGIGLLYGDDAASWKVREIHSRGTVAPGSVKRTDNELLFLLDDSVYKLDYSGAFLNNKISQEIDSDLAAHSIEEREGSVAEFQQNRYYLSIGDIVYVYDLTTGGSWSQEKVL